MQASGFDEGELITITGKFLDALDRVTSYLHDTEYYLSDAHKQLLRERLENILEYETNSSSSPYVLKRSIFIKGKKVNKNLLLDLIAKLESLYEETTESIDILSPKMIEEDKSKYKSSIDELRKIVNTSANKDGQNSSNAYNLEVKTMELCANLLKIIKEDMRRYKDKNATEINNLFEFEQPRDSSRIKALENFERLLEARMTPSLDGIEKGLNKLEEAIKRESVWYKFRLFQPTSMNAVKEMRRKLESSKLKVLPNKDKKNLG